MSGDFRRGDRAVWLAGFGSVAAALLAGCDPAFANDCAQYVKDVRNFVDVPANLVEDCMRTGYVQAIATGVIGMIGGGVIARGVTKAIADTKDAWREPPPPPGPPPPGPPLVGYGEGRDGAKKDNPWDPSDEERRAKWEKEKLVWDPRELTFRPPRPEEYPPPSGPPEVRFVTPFERGSPRTQTPPECLDLYDKYVGAQAELLEVEGRLRGARDEFQRQQELLQFKLGIFTAQFGADMVDFFQLGTTMVKAAGPISRAVGRMGSLSELARSAARRASGLGKAVAELLKELAELGARAVKLRGVVEVFAETARVLGRHADELAEGVLALEKRVAANRSLLAIAAAIETEVAKRGTLAPKLLSAEQRLRASSAVWERRQRLQRWAEAERVSIGAEQGRLAMQARAELEALEEEIRRLRARAAQSPELTPAAGRSGRAATRVHQLESEIAELEGRARLVNQQIEAVKKGAVAKQAFLEAETARDAAAGAADAADAEIARAQAKIEAVVETPEVKQLKVQYDAAVTELARLENELGSVEGEMLRLTNEREGRFGRGAPSRARVAEIDEVLKTRGTRRAELNRQLPQAQKKADKLVGDWSEKALANGRQATDAGLYDELQAARQRRQTLDEKLAQADASYDAAAKEIQRYSHPGMDFEAGPRLEQDLTNVRAQLKAKRPELKQARVELDQAHHAEQAARQGLDPGAEAALESRRAQAQAKLRGAERDWQQVAAERQGADFQQWKLEVEGTDPFREAPEEMRALQEEVLALREQEAEVERQINAGRDRLGGEDYESTKNQLREDQAALERKRQEHAAARERADSARAEHLRAEQEASEAERRHRWKEDELRNLQAQKVEAEADYLREAGPDAPSPDGILEGRGPADALDSLVEQSHRLSEQYKPGIAKWVEDGVKAAAVGFGEKWTQFFNGQSPEDVARIIKKHRDEVTRLKAELDDLQARYDRALQSIRPDGGGLKARLDACLASHQPFWSGPAEEGSHAGTP